MTKHVFNITIPDDLNFSDLKMTRDPVTGDIEFDWMPIERICEASGIDIAVFRDQHEDNVGTLIVNWYSIHCEAGGEPDLVQEQLRSEVHAEEFAGIAGVQTAPAIKQ